MKICFIPIDNRPVCYSLAKDIAAIDSSLELLIPPREYLGDLVKKADIKNMAAILPEDASWQFAQFMNQNCIDPSYNEIYPYSDQEAKDIIEYAKSFIPKAELR